MIKLVFFDVDGVLVDSLESHLQICRDKRDQYAVPIEIPTSTEFRRLVRLGAVISPMKEFFRAVGFPEAIAELAEKDYQRDFADTYPLARFDGVDRMLSRVATTRLCLGIVTANTRSNVERALGPSNVRLFDPDCWFTLDDDRFRNKSEALRIGARRKGTDPWATLYVGDQPKDFESARTAGTRFLGVTYGWGLEKGDRVSPLVESPRQVGDYIVSQADRP